MPSNLPNFLSQKFDLSFQLSNLKLLSLIASLLEVGRAQCDSGQRLTCLIAGSFPIRLDFLLPLLCTIAG